MSLVLSVVSRDDLLPFHIEDLEAVSILLCSYVPALEDEGRTENGSPVSLEIEFNSFLVHP